VLAVISCSAPFSLTISNANNSRPAEISLAAGQRVPQTIGGMWRPKTLAESRPDYPLTLLCSHVYEIRPRKDKRGFDLISDALPFGGLWYLKADNAIEYAKHRSRSHDAVIRVYDDAGNVIETHEHTGDFKAHCAELISGAGCVTLTPREQSTPVLALVRN
jgi:hypothetical protein